eukprot:g6915.t1
MATDLPEFPREKGYPFRHLYGVGEKPPMSTAMECSVALLVLFYAVDMGNVIHKFCFFKEDNGIADDSTSFDGLPEETVSINGMRSDDEEEENTTEQERKKQDRKNNNVFDRLASITSSIPMLLILFLISRLHGSVDLERTEPDEFMRQKGFVFATVCLFLEAFFAVIPNI